MKKNLLVSVALLAFSAVCANAAVDAKSITVDDGLKNQKILIRPDANMRLKLSQDQLTGIKEANEKKQSSADLIKKAKDMANQKMDNKSDSRQLKTIKLKNLDLVNKEKIAKSIRDAKKIDELPIEEEAPTRGGSRERQNQFNQPYYANGSDNVLAHAERHFSTNGSKYYRYGETVYTYDAKGTVIKIETTLTNYINIIDKQNWYDFDIPENAVLKFVSTYTDNSEETEEYFIDPATGNRQDLYYYKNVWYDGSTVFLSEKYVDEDGLLYEEYKTESEFDAQGRPTVTIEYDWYEYEDEDTAYWALEPYRKIEFEYKDEIVYRTYSYNEAEDTDTIIWVPDYKYARVDDEQGRTVYYEYLVWDEEESKWYGDTKYAFVYTYYPDGNIKNYTRTYWDWSEADGDWVPSNKQYAEGNTRNYMTYASYYRYSKELSSFYLSYTRSYCFLGDTLQSSYTYVSYATPTSADELARQDELFNYGYKEEFEYYTSTDLLWLGRIPDQDVLRKSYSEYYLDTENKTSFKWIGDTKDEYEYIPAKIYGTFDYRAQVSTHRNYGWADGDWTLNQKEVFNEQGDRTLNEDYYNGVLQSKQISEYVYFEEYDVYQGSYLEAYRTLEIDSALYDGQWVPSGYSIEKFDESARSVFYQAYGSWNATTNSWDWGMQYEIEYTGNNERPSSFILYSWDSEKGIFMPYIKQIVGYDEYGEQNMYQDFEGSLDEKGNTVWTPVEYYEDSTVSDGSITKRNNINCSNWNAELGTWEYAHRTEWLYLAFNGVLIEKTDYSMNESGEWFPTSKDGYAYNNGEVATLLHYEYDYESKSLVLQYKDEYEYSDEGNLLSYKQYDASGVLIEKYLAVMNEDDDIIGYVDSVYTENGWAPYYKIDFTYDYENLYIMATEFYWHADAESWVEDGYEFVIYDENYNLISDVSYYLLLNDSTQEMELIGNFREEYEYDEDGDCIMQAYYEWDSKKGDWRGTYKEEEKIDAFGNELLSASYYWNRDSAEWVGNSKYVAAFDSLNNQTLYATYRWSDSDKDWVGEYKKELEYDADGILIMETTYDGVDTLGNWIGDYKYSNYTKDDVTYIEEYDWDPQKNDWYGTYKQDYCYTDNYYMYASYDWDDEEWCWYGYRKNESIYADDGTDYTFRYNWNYSKKEWVGSSGSAYQYLETANSEKTVQTYYDWDESGWTPYYRYSYEAVYKSDDNLESRTYSYEDFDESKNAWVLRYSTKYVYVYKTLTSVEGVADDTFITVSEGAISVSAAEGSKIIIVSSASVQVAEGIGSVSAAVAPGIYMISVDGKATKVVVR